MKTVEEVLAQAYDLILKKGSDKHDDVDPILAGAMMAYAEQEVKKHLEIAAKEAYTKHEYGYDVVDEESITGIKIELT